MILKYRDFKFKNVVRLPGECWKFRIDQSVLKSMFHYIQLSCNQCMYPAANFFIIMGNVFSVLVAFELIRLIAASQICVKEKTRVKFSLLIAE